MPFGPSSDVFERDVLARMTQLVRRPRMWGCPEELEAVSQHFSHVLLCARTPGWSFAQTLDCWRQVGAPLAKEPEEHAAMRARLWGGAEDVARGQVLEGLGRVWEGLARLPERAGRVGPWISELLAHPQLVPRPDVLEMVLFTLMGFVASSPHDFVALVAAERERTGGHAHRALHVVGPPGPSAACLTWTRRFESWDQLTAGVQALVALLEAPRGRA